MDSIKKQSGNNERKEIRVKSREDKEEEETAIKTPVKDTGLGSQWRAKENPLSSDCNFNQVRF